MKKVSLPIYDREKKEIVKKEVSSSLTFLYETVLGRVILKILVLPIISKICGTLIKTPLSKGYISKFIKNNNINMNEYIKENYCSFDDFFTRKIKKEYRPIKGDKDTLIAVSDASLLAYKIDDQQRIKIKKTYYTVKELLDCDIKDFYGGDMLVFRLCVEDYHHYFYIDDGKLIFNKKINGKLHTVNPIAFDHVKVFIQNQREVSLLKTKNFSDVYQIEVGALNVGKIHNKNQKKFLKGDEKGYFSFGGSTIILLFKKDVIKLDDDIIENSKKNIEVRVKARSKIGIKVR